MSSEDDIFGLSQPRAFSPYLAANEKSQLHALLDVDSKPLPSFVAELRALAKAYIDDGESAKLRAVCLVIADLCEQGWQVNVKASGIVFQPPGISRSIDQSVEDVKSRVRKALQAARLRQLSEPSVRQFLLRVERRTQRFGDRKSSVLDLIDHGVDLAAALKGISHLNGPEYERALGKLISPVVEVCEAGKKCADTGLSLTDIWRYFRHTWAHEYRPIPGRQMLILIRNSARPCRPVMGIAMLASPVMRLATRDNWIGWLRPAAEERILRGEWDAGAFGTAMIERVEASISAIRWDDLTTQSEITSPSENVILRLEQRAAGAAAAREKELRRHYDANREVSGKVKPHRGEIKSVNGEVDWLTASNDLLFVRKRSETLANLLTAKHTFQSAELSSDPGDAVRRLLISRRGHRAIDIALGEFRKAGLSSQVADVSVCGGIAPYSELLSGKLVALLLASKEVRDAYSTRYGGQVSIIASQMAGCAVSKPSDLRVLTTTSLYGIGSSQYNRLSLRKSAHSGLEHDITWSAIGKSLTGGFGTLHLGEDTAQALRNVAQSTHESRRVNNRFGEGTSPRLRQIREGLDALGIESNTVLNHATPRIFYGCEFGQSARSSLLNLTFFENSPSGTDVISQAWVSRWLSNRVRRPETLEKLKELGPSSVRAALHADAGGQLMLPIVL